MKRVSELLEGIEFAIRNGTADLPVTGIAYDSRKVTAGCLFVCVKGYVSDGHLFLRSAAKAGAAAAILQKDQTAVADSDLASLCEQYGITIICVEDTRKALAWVSAGFFDFPSRHLALYGITGTKGKTTTTYMIRDIFIAAGKKTGLIGTVANIVNTSVRPASHTTPESFELQSVLGEMVKGETEDCIMEVSSQGLKLDRVFGCRFAVGAFTNLYLDHIGPTEHADMDDYLAAKLSLFDLSDKAAVNADCAVAGQVIAYAKKHTPVITYGIDCESDVRARNLCKEQRDGRIGTSFQLSSPWYNGDCFVAMPGKFNVYNALCAVTVAGVAGVGFEHVRSALANVHVPGRIQAVPNAHGFGVFVDYAHNAASLENVLLTLREYCEGRLITVFGCGGNRSRTRRFEMGEISGKMSDVTVVTSDNPRNEEPAEIMEDILVGMRRTDGVHYTEPDRETAIRFALSMAKAQDFVVIAGKGHENYQIFKDRTIHFDDAETASRILSEI